MKEACIIRETLSKQGFTQRKTKTCWVSNISRYAFLKMTNVSFHNVEGTKASQVG